MSGEITQSAVKKFKKDVDKQMKKVNSYVLQDVRLAATGAQCDADSLSTLFER